MPTVSPSTSSQRFAQRLYRSAAAGLHERYVALLQRPFAALVRYFCAKMFRVGDDMGSEDVELGIGALLGILAAPGAFLCLFLLDKYSSLLHFLRREFKFDPYTASIPDKYFLLVFAIVVTGIVTALKWDKILPDKQDFLNLAPLPVPSRTVFLANATAVLLVAALFVVDVNAVSALLFPVIVTASQNSVSIFLHFAAVHMICVSLAAAFTFCLVFSIMGLLMAVLPRRVFRLASLWMRGGIVMALLALLLSSFAGPAVLGAVEQDPQSPARWIPSLWYLSLYQSLQGRGTAQMQELASLGLWAALIVFVSSIPIYASCYRRSFLEASNSAGSLSSARLLQISQLWPRVAFGTTFQRACYSFVMRALLRSDTHCLCVGAFAGLGLILASEAAMSAPRATSTGLPAPEWLSVPLIFGYFLVAGLRLAFELPAALSANWVFRTSTIGGTIQTAAVGRRVILTCLAPLLLLPCFVAYAVVWGPAVAALSTLYVLFVTWSLAQILTYRMAKIPFTCATPPFRHDLVMVCLLHAVGFALFTRVGADLGHWLLLEPWRFGLLPVALLLIRLLLRFRPDEFREEEGVLVFDHVPAPAVEQLGLLDRS